MDTRQKKVHGIPSLKAFLGEATTKPESLTFVEMCGWSSAR